MTLTVAVVGWKVEQFRDRKRLIQEIDKAGGTYGVRIEGPEWIRKWVDDDEYFYSPVRLTFGSPAGKRVSQGKDLNDILYECAELPDLITLDLRNSELDDQALSVIGTMSSLEELRLTDVKVSETGLIHIHKLRKLQEISLLNTVLTSMARDSLLKAMPGCKIDDTGH